MRLLSDKRFLFVLIASVLILAVQYSFASSESGSGGHGEGVLEILIALIVILLAAKIGGDLFERVHQPAVLGELVMGMIIGNLHLLGLDIFEPFKHDITLEILAELGVIILLFEVGLESTVREMMRVGLASFMVAMF
ncbi:MAG: cation:proton antiporter, partial [candidate division Zixibacteria bacterium]|nr:cation:proton antiporter [candidate division Zixibacteria bacterium]